MKQSSALGLHLLGYLPAFIIAGVGLGRYVAAQESSGNDLASLSFLIYIYFAPSLLASFIAWATSVFDSRPEYIIRRASIIASLIAHAASAGIWIWSASEMSAGAVFIIVAAIVHCGIAAHAYSMLRIRIQDEEPDPIY